MILFTGKKSLSWGVTISESVTLYCFAAPLMVQTNVPWLLGSERISESLHCNKNTPTNKKTKAGWEVVEVLRLQFHHETDESSSWKWGALKGNWLDGRQTFTATVSICRITAVTESKKQQNKSCMSVCECWISLFGEESCERRRSSHE